MWGSFCALPPHHPAGGAEAAAHRLQCQVQGRHHTDQKGGVWSSSMGIKLLFVLGRDQIVSTGFGTGVQQVFLPVSATEPVR